MTGQGLTDNPFYQPGQSLDSNISKVYQYGLRIRSRWRSTISGACSWRT